MKVLAFGIVKDIFGATAIAVESVVDTAQLKALLEERYPRLKELVSYAIAVNDEYAQDNMVINSDDEVAIIPPVSGG